MLNIIEVYICMSLVIIVLLEMHIDCVETTFLCFHTGYHKIQRFTFLYYVHSRELKLQYFGHLMWRADSMEKTLMLRKIEAKGEQDDSGWGGWIASLTQWTWIWANSGRQWRTWKPDMLQPMGSQIVRHDLVIEQQQIYREMCTYMLTCIYILVAYIYLYFKWYAMAYCIFI